MADPITLTLIGTALTAGGTAAGTLAWQEARRARKDKERLQRRIDNPATASLASPSRKHWVKGGTEELYLGKDGSVAAIGKHQNDFSMGFVEGGSSVALRGQGETSSITPFFLQSAAMLLMQQRQQQQNQQQLPQQRSLRGQQQPQGYIENTRPPSYDFAEDAKQKKKSRLWGRF